MIEDEKDTGDIILPNQRVGVLGGAFNPIHNGHLNAASEIAEMCDLGQVIFMVSARPPHKGAGGLIDPEERYRMVELACQGDPRFVPSRIELDRQGPSYTIDTLDALSKEVDGDIQFIVGFDALADIASWKEAARLIRTYPLIVAARPGHGKKEAVAGVAEALKITNPQEAIAAFDKEEGGLTRYVLKGGGRVTVCPVTPLDISSTALRQKIMAGKSIRYLAPEAVERYCRERDIGKLLGV